MTFISIILALVYVQYVGTASTFQRDEWFQRYLEWARARELGAAALLGLAVLLPTVGVAWLMITLRGEFFGLLWIGVSVVALLYSFGRGDFSGALQRYRRYCREEDFEGAFLFVESTFGFGDTEETPHGPAELHNWVQRKLVYAGYQRWFAVIFYFVLLGAAGALGYRLLQLYREQEAAGEGRRMADQVLHVVDWLPARLLGLAFALTGDFVGSREALFNSAQELDNSTEQVLYELSHAALGLNNSTVSDSSGEDGGAFAQMSEWEIDQLDGLLGRSAVCWVVLISALVLLG